MTELLAEAFLHRHGLRLSDVRLVQMPFASMEIALRNHAVDFAAAIEPYAELGTRDGISVKLDGISALMPGFVQAVVLYGPRLSMRQRSVGLRFMHAFIRANRFLNSSLNTAEGRRTIAGIYQRAIPMDDPTIYRTVGLPQSPSDLAVRLPGAYGLNWQLQTYAERGLVASRPDLASFVDPTLVPPRSGKRP
jgi:ABC-type nitrate/sulfonate/bicarbonate transport system substrate-binding protein